MKVFVPSVPGLFPVKKMDWEQQKNRAGLYIYVNVPSVPSHIYIGVYIRTIALIPTYMYIYPSSV